eukprot:TRINITY_DN852_c0_g1_i7.p1 TRINITY_DN852_c0_g1~~TRINITY_DN852_c0_g1_i7.p1  ORF type:complete len:820 (+),score=191.32 TRINITY_DN852_c0_g1_i7:773-3232(+)
MRIWDTRNLSEPLATEVIDAASAPLFPFYDEDTRVVYLAGKGQSNVRYYEILNQAPYFSLLTEYKGSTMAWMARLPKSSCDTKTCNIFNFLKLVGSSEIEHLAFAVPRRKEEMGVWQADLYPMTRSEVTVTMKAKEWLAGAAKPPLLVPMPGAPSESTTASQSSDKTTTAPATSDGATTGKAPPKIDTSEAAAPVGVDALFSARKEKKGQEKLAGPLQIMNHQTKKFQRFYCVLKGDTVLGFKEQKETKKGQPIDHENESKLEFVIPLGTSSIVQTSHTDPLLFQVFSFSAEGGQLRKSVGMTPILTAQCADEEETERWVRRLMDATVSLFVTEHVSVAATPLPASVGTNTRGSTVTGTEDSVEGMLTVRTPSAPTPSTVWLAISSTAFYTFDSLAERNKGEYSQNQKLTEIHSIDAAPDPTTPQGKWEFEVVLKANKASPAFVFGSPSEVDRNYWIQTMRARRNLCTDWLAEFGLDVRADSKPQKSFNFPFLDLVKLKKGDPQTQIMHQFSGRRRILVQQVPSSGLVIERSEDRDVFVLDCGTTIYQYNGRLSSRVARARALQMTSVLKNKERNGTAKIVSIDAGKSLGTNPEDIQKFWKQLGGKPDAVEAVDKLKAAEKDKPLIAGGGSQIPETVNWPQCTIYSVHGEDQHGKITIMFQSLNGSQPKFSRSLLDPASAIVVDMGVDVFAWHGSKSSAFQKNLSLAFCQQLFKLRDPALTQGIYQFREIEKGESVYFKDKFPDWGEGMDMLPIATQKTVTAPVAVAHTVTHQEVDVLQMLKPRAAPDVAWISQNAEETLQIFRIDGSDKKTLPCRPLR